MGLSAYLVATDPQRACGDVIYARDTNLKIRVYCPEEEHFDPDPGEIQLYGFAGERFYIFETIGLKAEDALDVVSGIKWYARYIDHPEMEILPEDPRTGDNVAV